MSIQAVTKPVFILTVKVYIAPENADKFLDLFKSIHGQVLAEPQCVYFLFGTKQGEPGVFQWTEGWSESPEWFMKEQLQKPYMKPYMEATEPLFIKPREYEIYVPVEGLMNFKSS